MVPGRLDTPPRAQAVSPNSSSRVGPGLRTRKAFGSPKYVLPPFRYSGPDLGHLFEFRIMPCCLREVFWGMACADKSIQEWPVAMIPDLRILLLRASDRVHRIIRMSIDFHDYFSSYSSFS